MNLFQYVPTNCDEYYLYTKELLLNFEHILNITDPYKWRATLGWCKGSFNIYVKKYRWVGGQSNVYAYKVQGPS